MILPRRSVVTGLFAVVGMQVTPTFAQSVQLEEIIVTAQRREQSLQEVPISVDVVTGTQLRDQGFSVMGDFATYSPSVTINDTAEDTTTSIRGFGTQGNSLTLQTATPVFLDGLHYGRVTMIRTAFMDTERLEVLKGPQPLYFGMNATAGAFNIQSKRPTRQWEGDFSLELGNFGSQKADGGIGGPITDTLAFRIAGIYDHSAGPIKNMISNRRSPLYDNQGGRLSLLWEPSENTTVYTKVEASRQRREGDLVMACLTEGRLAGFQETGPQTGATLLAPGVPAPDIGNEKSVYAEPPKGTGFSGDAVMPTLADPEDCFKGKYGFTRSKPYLEPPQNIFNERSGGRAGPGYPDIREAAEVFYSTEGPDGPGFEGFDLNGSDNKDVTENVTTLLDITHSFANGIILDSETGFVEFYRGALEDNSNSFFLGNPLGRAEEWSQWSQQFRLESAAEGYEVMNGINLGFMLGVFHQESDLDAVSNSTRASIRHGVRFNDYDEQGEWTNYFWNLDFGFLEKQLTLSVGGRYSEDQHKLKVVGWGSQWIYNEAPCAYSLTLNPAQDANPATCPVDPAYARVNPALTTQTLSPGSTLSNGTRIDSPRILVTDNVDMNNLWTHGRWNVERGTPLNWRVPRVDAIGLTAPLYEIRYATEGGPYDIEHGADNYDTQVVLSYTPNALDGNHTFYGKYVEAFKGPISDTGFATLPATEEDLTFEPEYVTGYEIGAKGMLMDRRIRYDLSLFSTDFTDLQIAAAAPIFNPTNQSVIALNAGKQEVDGFEFYTQAAVTDNLRVSLGGTFMDGKYADLDGGGCSANELFAVAADAVNNPSGRTAAELTAANNILTTIGPERSARARSMAIPEEYMLNGGCRLVAETLENGGIAGANTYNRSGDVTPNTPDYKFIAGVDYAHPFGDTYQISLNANAYYVARSPHAIVEFPAHGDMNLSAGFGPQDGTWELAAFTRNIFAPKAVYNPAYDFVIDGLQVNEEERTGFTTYGLRFKYNYQ